MAKLLDIFRGVDSKSDYWAMTLVKDLKMIDDPKVWGKSMTMK